MNTTAKLFIESDSILLIVDMQEKLLKPISKRESLILNIKKLIDASDVLGIKNIYSEQNPDKLGSTIQEIKNDPLSITFNKMSFSCCGCKELVDLMNDKKINTVLICGIESHICVQQTCLELIGLGYNVVIAADAISSRNLYDHKIAIRRMEKSGSIISSTEAIIFEWCKTAEREEFKRVSEIIKKSI